MPVAMMDVRIMRVRMLELFMSMGVRVRLTRWIIRLVTMLVVFVMTV